MSASGTALAARQVPAHEVARMVRQLCGLQGTDQDVFSRPDVVRLMCEKTLYTVLCIDARESALPFHATELEMHKDAITELVFIKYATRLCLDFGIDFEPTRDMYSPQPDPKRVQYILTKIVSFLKFRDVEVLAGQEKFKPYLEPFNGLIETLDQLRAKNESNEDVMHRAYEKRARVESSVDMLRQQVATIEQTMAPKLQTHESLRQRNEELTHAVEAARAQLDETHAALQQATAACDECRTVLSEPPSVINEAIAALRHTIAANKAELTDLDAKARALGLRRACLLRIEKSLGKSMAHLQVLEELRAKYKQAKKETKNKEAVCAAEKDKEEKARKRLKVCHSHILGVFVLLSPFFCCCSLCVVFSISKVSRCTMLRSVRQTWKRCVPRRNSSLRMI